MAFYGLRLHYGWFVEGKEKFNLSVQIYKIGKEAKEISHGLEKAFGGGCKCLCMSSSSYLVAKKDGILTLSLLPRPIF